MVANFSSRLRCARQIVEQHVELRGELILPALTQILEEFLPMLEQQVQAAIKINRPR